MNKGLELSIKFKPHADNSVDYPNNIIMNKNAKKMYVAPSIKEHVVELEQGIAAGSQVAQPGMEVQPSMTQKAQADQAGIQAVSNFLSLTNIILL